MRAHSTAAEPNRGTPPPGSPPEAERKDRRRAALRDCAVIVLHNGLLAGAYWAAARFGLMLDAVSGFATLVWPSSGIALAAVVLGGPQVLPGVALGAFLANTHGGAPITVALGITAGNTLEAVVAACALRRFGFRASLERVRDVLLLLVLGALLSTLIAATIGAFNLWRGGIIGSHGILHAFRAWWIGDLIGMLVVAPVLLVFGAAPRWRSTRGRTLEALILCAAVFCTSLFAFHDWTPTAGQVLRYTYALFPLLMWAGLRFEQRGATMATLIASSVAVIGAVYGFGPFVYATLYERLVYLQAFMGVVALTGLFLGAATAGARAKRSTGNATSSRSRKNRPSVTPRGSRRSPTRRARTPTCGWTCRARSKRSRGSWARPSATPARLPCSRRTRRSSR